MCAVKLLTRRVQSIIYAIFAAEIALGTAFDLFWGMSDINPNVSTIVEMQNRFFRHKQFLKWVLSWG